MVFLVNRANQKKKISQILYIDPSAPLSLEKMDKPPFKSD